MATSNKVKILIAKSVISKGMKIKDVAQTWGVSTSTVRNYMDQWTEKKIKLDLNKELANLLMNVHCAKKDDADTLGRRLEGLKQDIELLMQESLQNNI